MMAMSIAITVIAQMGYQGSHMNIVTMLPRAAKTPTVRASTLPENTPNPHARTISPMIRWIHPHDVALEARDVVGGLSVELVVDDAHESSEGLEEADGDHDHTGEHDPSGCCAAALLLHEAPR